MRHANARMRQGEGGLGSWRCSSTPDQHRRRVSSIGHEKRDQPPLGRRAMTALGRSRQNWDQRLPRSCCSLEIGRLIQVPTSQCGLKLRNNRASSDEGLPTQGLRCDGVSAGDEAVRDWFVNLDYLWSCDLSLPVKFNRSKFRFLQVKRPASRGCEILDGARSFMRLGSPLTRRCSWRRWTVRLERADLMLPHIAPDRCRDSRILCRGAETSQRKR